MKFKGLLLVLLILTSTLAGLSAQVIKIASPVPESSPWGQGLDRIAAEWSQITNGRVNVRIFHGGIAGDESDSIRKMRLGQLQGSVLTTAGLSGIVPEVLSLSFPGIVHSEDELNYIVDHLGDELDRLFREKGYIILTWSNAGWLKLFSTNAIYVPEDLKGLKIASGTLPEDINASFRDLGMQPVPVSSPEILSALNSGLVEAVMYAPLGVAANQWFGVADEMLDLKIAPFLGAIVIDERTWNRIPEEYHDEMIAAARKVGTRMETDLNTVEVQAMDQMEQYGLKVNELSSDQMDQWQQSFDELQNQVKTDLLSNDFMQKVYSELRIFRGQGN